MESGSLKQVMILNNPMYAEGAPVLLESCGLYEDPAGGRIARLAWRNLDARAVSALNVTLTTFDSAGNRTEDIKYLYSGLEAASCQRFGLEACIPVGKADRYTVQLDEVAFSDGSVNRVEGGRLFELLPESKPLKFGSLNPQYIQDLKNAGYPYSGLNAPQMALGLWQCGCGQWNKSGPCCVCHITLDELRQIGDPAKLSKNLNNPENRITPAAEPQASWKAALPEERWKKTVNRKRIAKALVICPAAAVLLYVFIFRPAISYGSAMRLLNECRYDEAAEIFLETGYRDSEEKYSYCRYMKAQWLQSEGRYKEAIAVYEELDGYSDSGTQIKECRYRQALELQAAGSYREALIIYGGLKGYSDSEVQIKECRYQQATELEAAGEYAQARATYEYLDGYSDSETRVMECKYQQAAVLYKLGEYAEAYAVYAEIAGYRDVHSIIRNDPNIAAVREAIIAPFRVAGNYVTFGNYRQTKANREKTPIEWLVLEVQENKALLISRYGLQGMTSENLYEGSYSWKDCAIRSWLNDTFLNDAFSALEQNAILTTDVDNSPEQYYTEWWINRNWTSTADDENNTQDKLFLLSCAEANRYFGVECEEADGANENEGARVHPTEYSKGTTSDGYMTADGEPAAGWWLRSPGKLYKVAAYVNQKGNLGCENPHKTVAVDLSNAIVIGAKNGSDGYITMEVYEARCIRPAFWIDLESEFF